MTQLVTLSSLIQSSAPLTTTASPALILARIRVAVTIRVSLPSRSRFSPSDHGEHADIINVLSRLATSEAIKVCLSSVLGTFSRMPWGKVLIGSCYFKT